VVFGLGSLEHTDDCVVILQSVVVAVDSFVRVNFSVAGSVVQRFVSTSTLYGKCVLPVVTSIMDRREAVLTFVTHPVKLRARLYVW